MALRSCNKLLSKHDARKNMPLSYIRRLWDCKMNKYERSNEKRHQTVHTYFLILKSNHSISPLVSW